MFGWQRHGDCGARNAWLEEKGAIVAFSAARSVALKLHTPVKEVAASAV